MHSKALLLLAAVATSGLVEARPWHYEPSAVDPLLPRGFEVLPPESIDRLRAYHFDKELTPDARRDRIEAVFDELPANIVERLPLAPGLARLPAVFQTPFRALQTNRKISWRERTVKTRALLAMLPSELQRVVEPPRPESAPAAAASALPSRPPTGFENALSPTLYAQLLRVHADATLDDATKKLRLNAIMRNAPRDQLERLPLPAGFESLPAETLTRARALLHDFTLEWDERTLALQRFIAELPFEQQRAVLAGAAAAARIAAGPQLPLEPREALANALVDRSLDDAARGRALAAILDRLPADVRERIAAPVASRA